MSNKLKSITKKGTPFYSAVISIFVGLLIFCIQLIIFSSIIMKSSISLENIKLFLYIAIPIGAAASAFMNAYLNKQTKGMISGIIAAVIYSLITSVVLLIINGGGVEGAFFGIVALSVLSGFPAGILGANIR